MAYPAAPDLVSDLLKRDIVIDVEPRLCHEAVAATMLRIAAPIGGAYILYLIVSGINKLPDEDGANFDLKTKTVVVTDTTMKEVAGIDHVRVCQLWGEEGREKREREKRPLRSHSACWYRRIPV